LICGNLRHLRSILFGGAFDTPGRDFGAIRAALWRRFGASPAALFPTRHSSMIHSTFERSTLYA